MRSSATRARSLGREIALGMLCHLESHPVDEWERAMAAIVSDPPRGHGPEEEDVFAPALADPAARSFAASLVDAFVARHGEIDREIETTSAKWRLLRMDLVDRNIVRLAAVELAALPDTPRGVAVSEAVRLAARYGSERSASFVNGLVEALAKRFRPQRELEP